MTHSLPQASQEVIAAVRKLVKAKGRYHTEQNYMALVAALDGYDVAAAPPPLPQPPQGVMADDGLPPLPEPTNMTTRILGTPVRITGYTAEQVRQAQRDAFEAGRRSVIS